LLVSQHFDGGFAEDGEIERGALRRRVGEHDLVGQRGLAASRGARDDIKRKFRETAAQDFIEARDPGRQFVYFHLILLCSSFPLLLGIAIVEGGLRPHILNQAQR
jgi:hypothetical protein